MSIALRVEKRTRPVAKTYAEIPRPQAFRGRALDGPHEGVCGVFLKLPAPTGGLMVKDSILYRLDTTEAFKSYVGAATDFDEYEPLDLELVVRLEEKK